MCCLFGLLDYNHVFSASNKNTIISILSTECEARGTDATGIAYNVNGRLCVYKRALPAHKLRYGIPASAKYIMGHTRMTTQGSEKRNYNNHPFVGSVQTGKFALAHNGILYNDTRLRKSEALPLTKIQTDSYVAVQLIEQQQTLNFGSLIQMAEKVEGSFTFTVLDSDDTLYIARGTNPFCLFHFPMQGFYLYASTKEILLNAVTKLGLGDFQKEEVSLTCGDILRIDSYGRMKRSQFEAMETELYYGWQYRIHNSYRRNSSFFQHTIDESYIQDLKSTAFYYGYSPDDIDVMLEDGLTSDEIEELLWATDFELCEYDSPWDRL